jgi:hypothetical protein
MHPGRDIALDVQYAPDDYVGRLEMSVRECLPAVGERQPLQSSRVA